jgi:hypothetical protein
MLKTNTSAIHPSMVIAQLSTKNVQLQGWLLGSQNCHPPKHDIGAANLRHPPEVLHLEPIDHHVVEPQYQQPRQHHKHERVMQVVGHGSGLYGALALCGEVAAKTTTGGDRLYARPPTDPTRASSAEGLPGWQRPAIFTVAAEIYRPQATSIHGGRDGGRASSEWLMKRRWPGLFGVASETTTSKMNSCTKLVP